MRAGSLAVLLFGALLLLPGLGRMGAVDSTDARYLAIGREMWARATTLVPRLAGVPHLDKPPLTYWAASLGYALFGPTEFGGRCVEQLALLATALVVFRAAARWANPSWALPAALVFLTSALPFVLSRGLATDLFQLLFLSAALVAICDGAVQRSAARAAAAGAWLGVSMLAKGPIALLVAASVWGVFALCVRGRALLPARGVALGAALFAAIGVPWFALLVHRNPAILDWFLHVQLASRVTGTDRGHLKDATYLLRVALAARCPGRRSSASRCSGCDRAGACATPIRSTCSRSRGRWCRCCSSRCSRRSSAPTSHRPSRARRWWWRAPAAAACSTTAAHGARWRRAARWSSSPRLRVARC